MICRHKLFLVLHHNKTKFAPMIHFMPTNRSVSKILSPYLNFKSICMWFQSTKKSLEDAYMGSDMLTRVLDMLEHCYKNDLIMDPGVGWKLFSIFHFQVLLNDHSKPWFYTPDYGHRTLCRCFSLWCHKYLAVLRNISSALIACDVMMKNNGKVRDVRSLTIHWNIWEMVYYHHTSCCRGGTFYIVTFLWFCLSHVDVLNMIRG